MKDRDDLESLWFDEIPPKDSNDDIFNRIRSYEVKYIEYTYYEDGRLKGAKYHIKD